MEEKKYESPNAEMITLVTESNFLSNIVVGPPPEYPD